MHKYSMPNKDRDTLHSVIPGKLPGKSIPTIHNLKTEPTATGVLSDYKDHTDPEYVGPGTWNVIHRHAFNSQIHEQQISFIRLMNEICSGFPCTVCKGHCEEYIKNHPMEEYLDMVIEIDGERKSLGLFIWTWKFHNAVNARLKKPMMSWDTAYNLYSESESLVCSKKCFKVNGPADGSEHMNEMNNNNISSASGSMNKISTGKNAASSVNVVKKSVAPSQPFHLISIKRE